MSDANGHNANIHISNHSLISPLLPLINTGWAFLSIFHIFHRSCKCRSGASTNTPTFGTFTMHSSRRYCRAERWEETRRRHTRPSFVRWNHHTFVCLNIDINNIYNMHINTERHTMKRERSIWFTSPVCEWFTVFHVVCLRNPCKLPFISTEGILDKHY